MPTIRRHKARKPFLNYTCEVTGVHIVPLQAMVGQATYSSGTCLRCDRIYSACIIDTQVGPDWAEVKKGTSQ